MFSINKWAMIAIFMVVGGGLTVSAPVPADSSQCNCVSDAVDPPFLGAATDPNLLLLIDNSASMYDVAHEGDGGDCSVPCEPGDTLAAGEECRDGVVWHCPDSPAGESGNCSGGEDKVQKVKDGCALCFDETFDAANEYIGYFDPSTWYTYDDGDERFEPAADPGDCPVPGGVGGKSYSNDDVCLKVFETTVDDVTTVTFDSIVVTGNLLNWASASKFDVEKKILTGGKYAGGQFESEGRGCSGQRYIKQVPVSSGGTDYKLTLGTRTDDEPTDDVHTTLIDIFAVTEDGFQPNKCQTAIDLMTGDIGGFGGVKQAIIECMDYDDLQPSKGNHDKQALVHSLHDCWYLAKKGEWPGGGAQGFNFEKWCEEKYATMNPAEILADDPAYICSGDGSDEIVGDNEYIGQCWNPGSDEPLVCTDTPCDGSEVEDYRCVDGVREHCTDWNRGKGECKRETDWERVQTCTGGSSEPGWKWDSKSAELEACITAARERFCNGATAIDVMDPSDTEMSVGTTWGLPAMIISEGVGGQLDNPIATLKGFIQDDETPSGLLQEYAQNIRIGAMAFNAYGSKSEDPEPWPSDKDGTYIVQPVGAGIAHVNDLISNLNEIPANTWTPLAEAMFNAIGYYSQDAGLRINETDFSIGAGDAPITISCQFNNILLITDGASTADMSETMMDKIAPAGSISATYADSDGTDDTVGCGADTLTGSTFLDDLTAYAYAGDIYADSDYEDWTGWIPDYNIRSYFVLNGTPEDTGEGECNPLTLLDNAAANGGTGAALVANTSSDLSDKLAFVLDDISKRASAGSAASVIASTRSGEGAVYQALFWPGRGGASNEPDATWLGEVHALLVDSSANLYEDINGNFKLDDGASSKVVLFYDNSPGVNATMACNGTVTDGVCSGTKKSLDEVSYLWSAAEWLAGISDDDILSNRSDYISSEKKRYIYTWNDLNNNGAVDTSNNEWIAFVPHSDDATYWETVSVTPATGADPRPAVPYDFNFTTSAEVDALISWLRGRDDLSDSTVRKRQLDKPVNFTNSDVPDTITWRLGDIINSTPTVVGRPMENYHLLYKDTTYADFLDHYLHRRHVVYFGGNDGMLHAVNAGFYDQDIHGFCRKTDAAGNCSEDVTGSPELGAELWAYVPYNLLPHLYCLAKDGYLHKYYMDQKPRIFDVKIFDAADPDYPGGWGTILVAGMRFGGSKVDTGHALDAASGREFVSSYVIFDITDPEDPPTLLGELTYNASNNADMGFTVPIPAVVPMREGSTWKWYLVLGSGPTALDGTSTQDAKVAVFPLDALVSGGSRVFRIPNADPAAGSEAGRKTLASSPNGMVSDLISVDYDLDTDYRADALYFGTIEGTWGSWTGRLYRWVTNTDDHIQAPVAWSVPSEVIDVGRPISAAPSIGYDGDNYWIYFGTGRYYDKLDAGTTDQEAYYGIKEPMDCDGNFTWNDIDSSIDALTAVIGDSIPPGDRGLLRVDEITVQAALEASLSVLGCSSGGCLPTHADTNGDGDVTFDELQEFIVGGCSDDTGTDIFSGTDGWKYLFPLARERNLGQATLLGGALTYVTYQPFTDECRIEGESFIYALFYQTGTAYYESIFEEDIGLSTDDPAIVIERAELGRGLAVTPNLHVGKEDGSTAFVQTSTGEIVKIRAPKLPVKESESGRSFWQCN